MPIFGLCIVSTGNDRIFWSTTTGSRRTKALTQSSLQSASSAALSRLQGESWQHCRRALLNFYNVSLFNCLASQQLVLGFADNELRQLHLNRSYWDKRLNNIEKDLRNEPDQIRKTFEVTTAPRIEPAGAIILWPQEARGIQ